MSTTNTLNIINGILICIHCNQPMKNTGEYRETLVGYHSKDGHDHDDNCKGYEYKCPSNHTQMVYIRRTCSIKGCEWKGKETCFCHKEKKVEILP